MVDEKLKFDSQITKIDSKSCFETVFCIDLGIPIKSKHRAEDVLEYLGPNAAPPEDIEWVGYNFAQNHVANVQIAIKFKKFVPKSVLLLSF